MGGTAKEALPEKKLQFTEKTKKKFKNILTKLDFTTEKKTSKTSRSRSCSLPKEIGSTTIKEKKNRRFGSFSLSSREKNLSLGEEKYDLKPTDLSQENQLPTEEREPFQDVIMSMEKEEKYIEENMQYLQEDFKKHYNERKKERKQYFTEDLFCKYPDEFNENKKNYLTTLKSYEIKINQNLTNSALEKQNTDLAESNEIAQQNNKKFAKDIEEKKAIQESLQLCYSLIKKQKTAGTMRLVACVLASVIVTTGICYAIFSYPNYALDDVTIKQGITALVNSVYSYA